MGVPSKYTIVRAMGRSAYRLEAKNVLKQIAKAYYQFSHM